MIESAAVVDDNKQEVEEPPRPTTTTDKNTGRLNHALRQQLLKTQERVKRELLEQEDALRMAKRRREDVGLELYGMQQQLARLQASLDSMNDKHSAIVEERAKAEHSIASLKETHAEKRAKVEEIRRSVSKAKDKLDTLLETLRQAKTYNEEIKSEVAITRRVASKAGETVQDLEKDKRAQDVYIDGLYEQVKRLEADVLLTDAQLKAQKEETKEANKMIQQTNAELEVLIFEKKQLVQQWKSSILALNRRDQALAAAAKALKDSQSRSKDYSGEMHSLKLKLALAQTDKENLALTNNKLESEAGYLKEQIEKVKSDHESAKEDFEFLEKSLGTTNAEDEKVLSAIRKLQNEIESLNQKIELVTRKRKDLEQQIGTNKFEQTTVSKATMNLMKEEKALAGKIHDKEIEAANIQNQLARLNIDSLNSKSKSSALKEELEARKLALKNKDDEINRCEMGIRRRNEEVEKRMGRIDHLNRKYEQMLDGVEEGEPMGPLEATIKSLTKDVEQVAKESNRLQKEWLTDQTDLVQTIGEADDVQEKNTEISARLNIMKQKHLRLIQNIHKNEAEIKSIEGNMKGIHSDMVRLNELIAKNTQKRTDLMNSNVLTEKAFARELKELDRDLARMDAKIAEIKAAKKHLLNEIVEVERQVLQWEKKIQLEKETQAALHTSNDAKEAQGMQQEINRMRKRLASIERSQEELMQEMERAIAKREDINVKFLYAKNNNKSSDGPPTKAELLQRQRERLQEGADEQDGTTISKSVEEEFHATEEREHSIAGAK